MITLCAFLSIKQEEFKDYKIHFAIGVINKAEPKEKLYSGLEKFEEFQNDQTQKNFNKKYVISLVWYNHAQWIYAGVYQVCGEPKREKYDNQDCWHYDLKRLPIQEEFIGRAIFSYKKEYRASYPELSLIPKKGQAPADMRLSEILANALSVQDFSGFDSVNITYDTLKTIVNGNIPSWKNALSKAKGVYLIVDTKTGKQYVGSAYGEECIWSRWSDYAKDGHGGNAELKKLLEQRGEDYKRNFKYSILEITNLNIGNEYIIRRESYWKEVLLSREFGLNKN